jgi:hypothetical protein
VLYSADNGQQTPHRIFANVNTPTRGSAGEVEAVAGTAAYRGLIDRLKQRIRESHARAARALNTELVMHYWSIGREIIDQQRAGGWGDDIVGSIAQDLVADCGPARGFSRRNLFYMRRFAAPEYAPVTIPTHPFFAEGDEGDEGDRLVDGPSMSAEHRKI